MHAAGSLIVTLIRRYVRIGKRNVQFECLAVPRSVDRQVDLIFVDLNILSHHLENILLQPWQEVGSGGAPSFMGNDDLEALLCYGSGTRTFRSE